MYIKTGPRNQKTNQPIQPTMGGGKKNPSFSSLSLFSDFKQYREGGGGQRIRHMSSHTIGSLVLLFPPLPPHQVSPPIRLAVLSLGNHERTMQAKEKKEN